MVGCCLVEEEEGGFGRSDGREYSKQSMKRPTHRRDNDSVHSTSERAGEPAKRAATQVVVVLSESDVGASGGLPSLHPRRVSVLARCPRRDARAARKHRSSMECWNVRDASCCERILHSTSSKESEGDVLSATRVLRNSRSDNDSREEERRVWMQWEGWSNGVRGKENGLSWDLMCNLCNTWLADPRQRRSDCPDCRRHLPRDKTNEQAQAGGRRECANARQLKAGTTSSPPRELGLV